MSVTLLRRMILVAGVVFAAPAIAGSGVVEQAQCVQVARHGSTGGAVVGAVLGAVIGEGIASRLGLGGAGRMVGTAMGGVGGEAAGERVATSYTYECLLGVQHEGKIIDTKVVSKRQYVVGQSVVVKAKSNGTFRIR